jgi:hypothetical protein
MVTGKALAPANTSKTQSIVEYLFPRPDDGTSGDGAFGLRAGPTKEIGQKLIKTALEQKPDGAIAFIFADKKDGKTTNQSNVFFIDYYIPKYADDQIIFVIPGPPYVSDVFVPAGLVVYYEKDPITGCPVNCLRK